MNNNWIQDRQTGILIDRCTEQICTKAEVKYQEAAWMRSSQHVTSFKKIVHLKNI